MTGEIPYRIMGSSFTIDKPKPLPGHQAPLDRRHRWVYQSTDTRGDFWYRCGTCRRRKRVRPIVNLLARKMRDAERSMSDYLNETLFL